MTVGNRFKAPQTGIIVAVEPTKHLQQLQHWDPKNGRPICLRKGRCDIHSWLCYGSRVHKIPFFVAQYFLTSPSLANCFHKTSIVSHVVPIVLRVCFWIHETSLQGTSQLNSNKPGSGLCGFIDVLCLVQHPGGFNIYKGANQLRV